MAKVFLVVDIFVAEGDGKNALGEKVALLMMDVTLVTRIADNLADPFGELEFLIDFLEKDRPGIGGQFGAVEEDIDFFLQAVVCRQIASQQTSSMERQGGRRRFSENLQDRKVFFPQMGCEQVVARLPSPNLGYL